ncbi:replicative DNA helicase [Streptosporangium vulgare]|uniref:DNA 5'-3' helicase n=1 Tax=Streptosporangium vulgare TaxID=46190 RepID=A0ABV5TUL5_9ACTN
MSILDDGLDFDGWAPSDAIVAAEIAVAGAAIQSQNALTEAMDLVEPGDFFSAAKDVFAAAISLLQERKPIEPTAVLGELQARGALERVGGASYLSRLLEHAAVHGSISYHARRVADDGLRRRISTALQQGRRITESHGWDAGADIDMIRKLLDEAAVRRIGDRPRDVAQDMIELLNDLENPPAKVPGVIPPFLDLASLITSFQPGQLAVIAGRPSMGKSVLASDIARAAAIRDGHSTLFFSVEMSRREVLQRMSSAQAKVPLHAIRAYDITPEDLAKVSQAAGAISGAPLIVDESRPCTLDHVRSQMRWLSRSGPIGIVIIDYLQIMTAPKMPIREQEIATLTRELKLLAGEFNTPVIALSQLNRESEKRTDKRPLASDLRESGAIEQDADIVILVHRDDFYEPQSPRAGEADLIVAKNRNGPKATVTVASQLHFARFSDMAATYQQAPTGRPNLHAVK